MGQMSDDEKALLTEEELAGLEEDADDGSAGEDGDDDAGEGNGDAQGDDIDALERAADDDDAEAAAASAAAAEVPAEGRDDGKDDDDDAPAAPPAGDRVDPAAVQTQLDDIATQKAELAEKLDDGEITTKEYAEAVDKLNEDKNQLSNSLARQQEHDETITKSWYKSVETFLDKNPDLKANQTRLQSFDAVVRRVTGDPENASLSNRKQLEKAQAIWREEMGIPDPAKASPAAPKVEAPKPKPKPALPPTLHNVPAADINDSDDGKYSHLDALLNAGKSLEYEDALSRLSPAEADDYLSRA